jgi:16S rRNA (cytosine967-C5)-methyltransferase
MENRGEIFALDLMGSKLGLIRENCHRLGITMVHVVEGDATQPLPFPEGTDFHRILVDAPCTGLGILHRNPEAKWRRKPEDIPRLAKVQTAILDQVSSGLKPGGVLVYSTCTMTLEENDGVVETFLAKHPDFEREDLSKTAPLFMRPLVASEGFFRTYPEGIMDQSRRMDGFFAARLRKT